MSTNQEEEFIFPITPSPKDDRDYIFEHRITNTRNLINETTKIPKEADLRKNLNHARYQGKRGTCAAFSACAVKEYHERLDVNYQGYFSPNSVYFYRENKPSAGMYLRDVMKILGNRGVAHEEDFPYDTKIEPDEVPTQALNRMSDYKIKSYARVHSIDGLKQALINHGPCIIAFPVYDQRPEFWKVKSDPKIRGGHAVTVVGYNKNGFILRNSWGRTWNLDGHVLYPYEEWGSHWECWVAVDAESPHIFKDQTKLEKLLRTLGCTSV